VVTGGFVAGRGGNSQSVNHPTTGRIPSGAIVEQSPPSAFNSKQLRLQLRRSDFTNASRVTAVLNREFGSESSRPARAQHGGMVVVDIPACYQDRVVDFVALIENLELELDRTARIVINERTGTIVLGKDVRIAPVSILHGNLTVEVETSLAVSQPNPISSGETAVVPQVGVGVKEDKARNVNLKPRATVEDLVQALLAIGSTPRDVIAILQSLQTAGALTAEIEVI
jgi:flagellar P-ring protein precursor FlgI